MLYFKSFTANSRHLDFIFGDVSPSLALIALEAVVQDFRPE